MLRDEENKADMSFEVQLLSYKGSDHLAEEKILKLKACLELDPCPQHTHPGNGPKGDSPREYYTFLETLNYE